MGVKWESRVGRGGERGCRKRCGKSRALLSLGPRVAFRTHLARACSRTERAFEPRPRRHGVPTPNDDRTALDRRPRDYHRPANPPLPPSFSPLLPPALHTIVSAPNCARSSRSESSERTTFSPLRPTYLDVSLCTRPNARPRVRSCVRTPCYSLRSNASFHLLPGERTLR